MRDKNEHRNTNKRRRKEDLINEASSSGSYLWSSKDLKNAILWLEKDDDSTKCLHQLIGPLLHSPGICHEKRKIMNSKKHRLEIEPLLPQIISRFIKHTTTQPDKNCKIPQSEKYSINWLHSTLSDVSMDRRMNQELFDRYDELYQKSKSPDQHIWNFLANPNTIVKSVYAAQIYEELVSNAEKSQINGGAEEYESTLQNPDTSMSVKLSRIAELQTDVAEVYLLVMLEPFNRKHKSNFNWIHLLLSTNNFDDDIADHEEREAFRLLCKSILSAITEDNICKLPPPLLCIISKTSFPFAKAFIKLLISCAVKNYEAIPKSIVNQALAITVTADPNEKTPIVETDVDCDPKARFDCCVERLTRLQEISDGMKSLFRDICHICRSSFQLKGTTIQDRALDEIEAVCFL